MSVDGPFVDEMVGGGYSKIDDVVDVGELYFLFELAWWNCLVNLSDDLVILILRDVLFSK